jgi:predicted permease
MHDGIRTLRVTIRQLVKSPVFACTAIFVLAFALAANVTIFGLVEATLIKPLPYSDQSQLVEVGTAPRTASVSGPGMMVSYVDYVDWRAFNHVFSSIDAYDVRNGFTLRTPGAVERVTGAKVTAGFFHTLGVSPVFGRDFRADEEQPSAQATVILSYGVWHTRFGGRPDVLGESLTLDDAPHVIIGVLPPEFHFAPSEPAEFWVPIQGGNACWKVRGCQSLHTVARLKDGVSRESAQADMRSVAAQLERSYPNTNRNVSATLWPLREVVIGDVRPILLLLLSGAALVLGMACVNVASLLLIRFDSRAQEIAVRKAFGASPAMLFVQFAMESVVLVATALSLALIGAQWGMRFLTRLISTDMMNRMPYLRGLGLNWRTVAVAAAGSAFIAGLLTLTPIRAVLRSERGGGLKDGSRWSAGTTWRRLGRGLVLGEMAIAVVLLVSAGLLARSLYLMLQVDPGLRPEHITTVVVGLPFPDEPPRRLAVAQEIVDRVAMLPGVQSVGYTDLLPLSPSGAWPPMTAGFKIVGRVTQSEQAQIATVRSISPGYFATMRARLLRGRPFTEADDAERLPVVIINQTMATQYFRGEDPIGQQLVRGDKPPMQIVGVVADIQEGSLDTQARPAVYSPFAQRPNSSLSLVVRTAQSDLSGSSLTAAVREVRSGLVIYSAMTLDERISRLPSAYLHRSSAWLVGSFAAMALLLGITGLYGVVSYSVGQRTREMGVRIALGAQRHSLYRLVFGEAAWLVGLGAAVGLVGGVIAARLMRRLLFGVEAWDITTLVTVTLVLIVSALIASYIPARRAASVNPIDTLRAE